MRLSRSQLGVLIAGAVVGMAGFGGARHATGSARAELDISSAAKGERQTLIFEQKLATVPGRQLAALTVDYAPGGVSPAHHHGKEVEIFAYVVSGAIRSKVNDGPETVYQAGQFWYEPPGSAHGVSKNASATEPARLLAVFVAADGATLTTVDPVDATTEGRSR